MVAWRSELNRFGLTQATERLDPAMGALALGRIQRALATPAADLLVVRRFHNIRNVTVRIGLQAERADDQKLVGKSKERERDRETLLI